MSLRRIAVVVAVCWLFADAPRAVACNFHGQFPAIVSVRDNPAGFIVRGYIENAVGKPGNGSVDFVITETPVPHAALKGKKVVTLPQFVAIPDPKNPPRFLILGDVTNGEPQFIHGLPETPALAAYTAGILKVDAKDRAKQLRYAFDFLESEDAAASADAFLMYFQARASDLSKAAASLDAARLRKWLSAQEPRPMRLGLYAHLLGYCGKPEDATLLRKMLDDPPASSSTSLDGVLIGFTLLDTKAGYDRLTKLVANPAQEFVAKYAALKALRFFWEARPEVLTKKQILDGMTAVLAHPDVADLAIDDLRKWKVWELTDTVLKYADAESHNALPINRRAILKFALAASVADPKNATAAAHVAKMRKTDPERVKMMEEILKDEPASKP